MGYRMHSMACHAAHSNGRIFSVIAKTPLEKSPSSVKISTNFKTLISFDFVI